MNIMRRTMKRNLWLPSFSRVPWRCRFYIAWSTRK